MTCECHFCTVHRAYKALGDALDYEADQIEEHDMKTAARITELEELLRQVAAKGPWYSDDGDEFCFFGDGCKPARFDHPDSHSSDCLWLAIREVMA